MHNGKQEEKFVVGIYHGRKLSIIGRFVSIGAPLVGGNVVGVLVASMLLVVANCY